MRTTKVMCHLGYINCTS